MFQLKFLIDENVDYSVAIFMRKQGYDVKTIVEMEPSIEDQQVLAIANKEERILITNDKDFGKLVFKEKLPRRGIVLFRLNDESSQIKISRLKELFTKFSDKLASNFSVLTEDKIRINEF